MSDYAPAPLATRAATRASDVGDSWIEGTRKTSGPGFFLDEMQRVRLAMAVDGRVSDCADAFYAALASVNLEEALRKREDLDAFTLLAIDALEMATLGALRVGARWLRGASTPAIFSGEIAMSLPSAHAELSSAVKSADESAVGWAMKQATSAGKGAVKRHAGSGDEFDRDREAVGDFAGQIGAGAALAFQAMRESSRRDLDDAGMVLLYHSLSADRCGVAQHAAKLREKIAAFRASPASKIGRSDRRAHGERPEDMARRGDVRGAMAKAADSGIRDTKLVLESYADGSTPMLLYYYKDYEPPIGGGQGQYDHTKDISLLDESARWVEGGVVESEMVDAAIQRNREMWGRPYDAATKPTPRDAMREAASRRPNDSGAPSPAPLRRHWK